MQGPGTWQSRLRDSICTDYARSRSINKEAEALAGVRDIHTAATAGEVNLNDNLLHIFKSVTDYIES